MESDVSLVFFTAQLLEYFPVFFGAVLSICCFTVLPAFWTSFLRSKLRVFFHTLHHGIRQLVNLYRLCHQRRSFLQVNFSDFFRKFI